MSGALRWSGRLVLGLTLVWVLVLTAVFSLRIGFPLELEWMEGGSLQAALRLQEGRAIYPEPSAEFVPFLYTPLYPALLAGLGWVLPLGYVLGRGVSVAGVIATAAGLWRLVGEEGKPRTHQAAAVGMFLAGYVFTFRWYDVARADSLFLALLVWGLVLLRGCRGKLWRAVGAGVLVGAAFWAKQTAAVFVVASGLGCLLVAPRSLWVYAGTIALIDGGGVLIGQWLTEGWLWRYIFELHQSHAFNAARFWQKTWAMFLHAAPFLVVLALWVVMRTGLKERVRGDMGRGTWFWGLMAGAGLLVSALGYATQWAEPNAFMPGVCFAGAWLAVCLPVGRGEAVGLGLVGAQLGFALVVEPRFQVVWDRGPGALGESYALQRVERTIPSAAQRGQARALREELEGGEGPVLALQRPWWGVLAGGPGQVGSMGIHDVPRDRQMEIERSLAGAVLAREYARVWLEGEPPRWLRGALSRSYRVRRRLEGAARVVPMTGYMSEAGMVTPWTGAQVEWVRQE